MLKRFKHALLILLVLTASQLAMPAQANAQTRSWTGVCVGENIENGTDSSDVATIQGLECLIANVFTVIITLIGFLGFVMFIIGSFRWMLSGGNSKGVDTAKGTMTYAVVGIVVALSAYIILGLISQFTGVTNILEFRIPRSEDDNPGFINSTPSPLPTGPW